MVRHEHKHLKSDFNNLLIRWRDGNEVARKNLTDSLINNIEEEGLSKLKELWGGSFDAKLYRAIQVLDNYSEEFEDQADLLFHTSGNNAFLIYLLYEVYIQRYGRK